MQDGLGPAWRARPAMRRARGPRLVRRSFGLGFRQAPTLASGPCPMPGGWPRASPCPSAATAVFPGMGHVRLRGAVDHKALDAAHGVEGQGCPSPPTRAGPRRGRSGPWPAPGQGRPDGSNPLTRLNPGRVRGALSGQAPRPRGRHWPVPALLPAFARGSFCRSAVPPARQCVWPQTVGVFRVESLVPGCAPLAQTTRWA